MKIHNGIWKLSFGTPESIVPSKQRYVKSPDSEAIEKLPSHEQAPFEFNKISFSASARGSRLEIPLAQGEDIYGFGLQLKSICHTGKKRCLRVNSDPVTDTGDSHAPAPLYFSTAGYGILVDTARYASFYCGGNKALNPEAAGESGKTSIALDESELYAGKGGVPAPMLIDIPAAQGIDIYVFAGQNMLEAVRRYVLFCGGGALPPEWGLGVWYRTCGTHTQKEVTKMAEDLRSAGIPCDVLGLEPGWQSKAYSCSLDWSKERFPEPEKMTESMIKQGYHVNLWEHVFIHPSSPIYKDLADKSGDFEVWNGLVPDLSIKDAASKFSSYHAKALLKKGISSFKLDECDNSDFITSPWSFPECSKFPSGADGEQMHSMLGLLYQEAIEDACRSQGIRSYGSVRSSHAFAAPQPYVLYSDLYEHKDFIRGLVNCGFSAMLWTPELRHAASKEDYIRRLQAMLLSPQMLLNIWSMPNPPWMQLNKELNRAGQFLPEDEQKELLKYTKEILELRMSFIPYLYSAFADYHFDGIPPFRALVMDYPDVQELRKIDYAWMAGSSLLVVPFTAGTKEITMPLPPGLWHDFHTGSRHEGSITIKSELDQVPIFVKDNSIIPFADASRFVTNGMKYKLTLRTYGKHPEAARLYADDGFSLHSGKKPEFRGTVDKDGRLSGKLDRRYEIKEIMKF